ncbi:hypothetical protein [Yoonia sp.]|uniref:hypothetical protein n=1 Tax=Yoonia sp. TaxID=2212373 RepID=UPI002FDAE7B1
MKGTILEFNVQNSTGVISGDDGGRYTFGGPEWKSQATPSKGTKVDFIADENHSAREVYTAVGAGLEATSGTMTRAVIAIVCAVLAFFIPIIGIVLAVVGLVLGRQARKAAKAEGDDNAALVALIAIVVAAISLIFAAIGLVSLLALGSGLAILGSGSLL